MSAEPLGTPAGAAAGAVADAVATAFVRALARGGWDDAVALSALATPPDAPPADFLRDLWTRLVAGFGALEGGRLAASAPHGPGRAVEFAVRLTGAALVLRVVVSAEARVVGFWITPPLRAGAPNEEPAGGAGRA